jgi:uncharacterized protein
MRSHILDGTVRHRRARPFVYELDHDVWYAALDLSELDEVARANRLLGRNRSNILSFRDRDHMDPPADDVATAIDAHLRADGFDPDGWRITLVTNLRVFGYVFNPASFFLCRDRAGDLRVVVIEVHNTHGERHLYTLRPADETPDFRSSMDKAFYVSPFLEMAGAYTVRVRDESSRLRITINEHEDDVLKLHTSLDLRRIPMTDRNLARMLVAHPFVTHKTIAMIHVHAWRLWRRGARFHRHGEATR